MWVCRKDFEYVVRKQELQKIAFGSGCERDTSSKKGMTPFMRHYIYEDFPNISPTKYNPLDAFKAINTKPCPCAISRKGYSGIARFADTLNHGDDHPSPAEYSISTFPPKVKQSKYPFSSTAKRQTNSTNKNPGPGTHLPGGKRQIMYDHSFGGRVKMRLGVELKCCQRNTDICDLCQRKPLGDYWHKRNKSFLCRPCMLKEHREHKIYNAPQLKEFRASLKKNYYVLNAVVFWGHQKTEFVFNYLHYRKYEIAQRYIVTKGCLPKYGLCIRKL
ncbi:uncharacterized protein LOC107217548 isoform X1 [Neodiprion lecontei]|uniref:Uncharacterized protein LOC107217548 isoform X1 n=2 Tax=Neodiprion lecontei TaxID=441921 RepID=A0ABM3GDU1_NEOLC|nr:uncharacterized protein LOC124220855 isoform X1 [Neodiprion pinetum]XP_046598444.1 uncharacterized protein LOC107217548 isoform X1 [Neodiprion lecontei]